MSPMRSLLHMSFVIGAFLPTVVTAQATPRPLSSAPNGETFTLRLPSAARALSLGVASRRSTMPSAHDSTVVTSREDEPDTSDRVSDATTPATRQCPMPVLLPDRNAIPMTWLAPLGAPHATSGVLQLEQCVNPLNSPR